MLGNINSIETMGLVDGPGIRVVIFLQGCKMRCSFCHNPEMWSTNTNLQMTSEELVRRILKYKNYFDNNGGVTFSGGEPLLQKEFLIETLKLCKTCNIHTALDTCGFGDGDYEELLEYVDLVLFDIKALDKNKYREITTRNIDASLKFLNECQRLNKKMWLRQVIVPGINDNVEYIKNLKEFIKPLKNIEKIEFLPYHLLGVEKYKKLGIKYRLDKVPAMDEKRCEELYKLFLEI